MLVVVPSTWPFFLYLADHPVRDQVQAPAMRPPTDEEFYSKTDPSKPDIAFLKNHFYREGRLTEEQALFILEKWVTLRFRSGVTQ